MPRSAIAARCDRSRSTTWVIDLTRFRRSVAELVFLTPRRAALRLHRWMKASARPIIASISFRPGDPSQVITRLMPTTPFLMVQLDSLAHIAAVEEPSTAFMFRLSKLIATMEGQRASPANVRHLTVERFPLHEKSPHLLAEKDSSKANLGC